MATTILEQVVMPPRDQPDGRVDISDVNMSAGSQPELTLVREKSSVCVDVALQLVTDISGEVSVSTGATWGHWEGVGV